MPAAKPFIPQDKPLKAHGTANNQPILPWLTVDIRKGHITLDRREEVLQDPVLSGEIPLHPWTSLQHDGWSWERVEPGDRWLEEEIPFES